MANILKREKQLTVIHMLVEGSSLRSIGAERAKSVHPELDAGALAALDPAAAVRAKESLGGTGPGAVDVQLAWIREQAGELQAAAETHGSLEGLAARVFAEPLE